MPLREAGAVHDVAQAQRFARLLERPQNLRRVHQRLDEVELVHGAAAVSGGASEDMREFYIPELRQAGRFA